MSDEHTNSNGEVDSDDAAEPEEAVESEDGHPSLVLVLAGVAGFGILIGTGALIGVEAYTVDWDGEVELVSEGETVETFSVVHADTQSEKESGLGGVSELEAGTGMLFLHDEMRTFTYAMPRMEFDIDILFIDDSCVIQAVHEADAPTGNETGVEPHHQYRGVGKYVLEVPKGAASGVVEPGDSVRIDGGCEA
ncbi:MULTISPECIES: DUF192 domain-containing protein [Haloferacaceae]|uniref:DUF192 domain-containing protein n=2 Tax=Haloferacaceae TaxID=1644056 RepID=A0ABD6DAZ8_9EURY|nr:MULTISPECIES: DUF192 domain-containing protein [Halorubraceae]